MSKKTRLIVSLIAYLMGGVLLWIYGSWQIFLGVFLFTYGNNLSLRITK